MLVNTVLLVASLTIFSIFGFAYSRPETDSGALSPIHSKRHAISGQRLSNAERIAKSATLRPRQSQPPQTQAFHIEASRLNSNPPQVGGWLMFDDDNGVVISPLNGSQASRVVFEVSSPLSAVGVTIKARNAMDDGDFPIVTRDWGNPEQTMSTRGNQ
ncbi:hypothetical protein I204_04682 [Kwoniella mangroviensis CBS 8886]|nr:hypothetical protein I204_04682 [Kwoniella mangroviensis CBS 8886]